MKLLTFVAMVMAMSAAPSFAQAPDEPTENVEVMILGVYHFSNPGRDVVNVEVDDFLTERRQRELTNLADALAQWKPTRVAVENVADAPNFLMESYARADELLSTDRNETVQIGYRVARHLDHEAVYGFDEQSSDGEPNYFPFEAVQTFAKGNGDDELLQSLIGEAQMAAQADQAAMPDRSVAETLFRHNDPQDITEGHNRLYYSMLSIGDGNAQPGAELNGYWYMRNAKMFAKLDMIAEPGDRVLVIVGSGHATWLRHFVEKMPGYRLVEPMPYLIAAAALDDKPE